MPKIAFNVGVNQLMNPALADLAKEKNIGFTRIALEILETRIPWRGFWQDWFTAGLALVLYILASMTVSGATLTAHLFMAAIPQIILAVLLYPLFSRLVAWLDRFRLSRSRRIG